jgi:subtilisin family serine protease
VAVLAVAAPFVPNDPGFEPNRASLEAMSVPQAWSLTQGDPAVVIAVVDSGVTPGPDLALTAGWNVVDGNADMVDQDGHGTAVAEIVGAAIDNGVGSAGICGECRIMPIKSTATTAAAGIDWAVSHGASVIDVSCTVAGHGLDDAIANAMSHGVPVFVCAGGVTGRKAIRVAAFAKDAQSDPRADVTAASDFTGSGGDSSATAAVSGIAGLMLSCNPALTPSETRRIMAASGGEVNAYSSVTSAGCRATPPEIVRLMVRTRGHGTVTRRPDDDTYNAGTVLVLRAKAKPRWRFARWDGLCRGQRALCRVRLNQSGVTTAVFKRK